MDEVQKALKERYSKVHPLLFHRSIEYAKTNGELFDILEEIPEKLPIVWDFNKRRWIEADLLQSKQMKRK